MNAILPQQMIYNEWSAWRIGEEVGKYSPRDETKKFLLFWRRVGSGVRPSTVTKVSVQLSRASQERSVFSQQHFGFLFSDVKRPFLYRVRASA